MNLTVVNFKAYNNTQCIAFLDKTDLQIHEHLLNICSTYEVSNIIKAKNAHFEPLNLLTKYITDANSY